MENFTAPVRTLYLSVLIIITVTAGIVWLVPFSLGPADNQAPPLRAVLDDVPLTPQRLTVIGYEREAFGPGWRPAPDWGEGCTVRDSTIYRQTANLHRNECDISRGTFFDPYQSTMVPLNRDGPALEVDHIFPLAAAWDSGAYGWSQARREAFANDPLNLVATQRAINRDKSDALPSQWLPPARQARCWYVRRLAAVAAKYDLTLSRPDVAVMKRQCWLAVFGP